MKKLILFLSLIIPFLALSQTKKVLDINSFNEWRSISRDLISNDGKYVAYSTESNGYGNEAVYLHSIDGKILLSYERGSGPSFTNNSNNLIFKISPDFFECRDLKRKKIKEKDLPSDTLAIYDIENKSIEKFSGLKSFKVPEKWDGYLIYLYEPVIDSTNKKEKKRSKKNGYDLVVKNLTDKSEVIFPYVLDYSIAEEGSAIALTTTGNDSTILPGVYSFDFNNQTFDPVFRSKGEYSQLAWDKEGTQLSFISDTDTTKALDRDYQLHYFKTDWDSSKTIAKNAMLDELMINKDFRNYFSESGKRLFFQTKEFPVQQDTSLLDEDIVNVEVWNTKDQRLFTHQENEKNDDLKFGYLSYYDISTDKFIQLGGKEFSDVELSNQGDGKNGIAVDNYQYRKLISWKGYTLQDVYDLDLATGEKNESGRGDSRKD